jgi:RNA polymerase sigma-70 factor (ECF subfamily)
VQEALMKAWGYIGQMEGKAQFKTWFTSIVLHASQGFYRHEHHHREDVTLSCIECEDAVVSDKRAPLLEQLSANERRMELMAAIAELDEPHQSVIRLHYFEGMTFKEVATQLNAPVGTVRRHAKEAREQLFKILSQPA